MDQWFDLPWTPPVFVVLPCTQTPLRTPCGDRATWDLGSDFRDGVQSASAQYQDPVRYRAGMGCGTDLVRVGLRPGARPGLFQACVVVMLFSGVVVVLG